MSFCSKYSHSSWIAHFHCDVWGEASALEYDCEIVEVDNTKEYAKDGIVEAEGRVWTEFADEYLQLICKYPNQSHGLRCHCEGAENCCLESNNVNCSEIWYSKFNKVKWSELTCSKFDDNNYSEEVCRLVDVIVVCGCEAILVRLCAWSRCIWAVESIDKLLIEKHRVWSIGKVSRKFSYLAVVKEESNNGWEDSDKSEWILCRIEFFCTEEGYCEVVKVTSVKTILEDSAAVDVVLGI